MAAIAVALVLLAVPGGAVAQGGSAPGSPAFGPLAPPTPPVTPTDQPQQPQQPQPQLPVAEADDQMLSTTELLAFLGIEVLLLGGLGVAIAREGGGVGRQARRARHARRTRPPRRKRGTTRNRGDTHSRAGAKVPPPPPRRRRAKAGRR